MTFGSSRWFTISNQYFTRRGIMDEKKINQQPIINSIQGELKPVDYSRIEKLRQEAGVTSEYLKKIKKDHKPLTKKADRK